MRTNEFLELTYKTSGKKVLVNTKQIIKIKTTDSGNSTQIALTTAENYTINVEESYDTIKELLFSQK